jgi:hypothetical protein
MEKLSETLYREMIFRKIQRNTQDNMTIISLMERTCSSVGYLTLKMSHWDPDCVLD